MASAAVPGTVNVFGNQPVFVQQANAPRRFTEKNGKRVTALGVVQLAAGILAIVFQASATGIEKDAKELFIDGSHTREFQGCGIWCGAMFTIAGLLGVLAGKRNRTSLIVTFLVFNIVISVIVWVLVGFTAFNLVFLQDCPYRSDVKSRSEWYTYYYYDSHYYNYNTGSPLSRIVYATYYYTGLVSDCSLRDGVVGRAWQAMDSLLLIVAIFEFAIAVTSAAYCCRALSCSCRRSLPPVFIVQPSAGPAGTYYYGPSMQPMFLQQGSSIQCPVITNSAMVAGPVGYSTGLSSAQLQPQFVHEAMPSAPVNGAPTSSRQYIASTSTAPVEHPVYENDPNAPPHYYELNN